MYICSASSTAEACKFDAIEVSYCQSGWLQPVDFCDDIGDADDLMAWSGGATTDAVARQGALVHGVFTHSDAPNITYDALPDHVLVELAMEVYIDVTTLAPQDQVVFSVEV